jgi:hypothetical protein
MHGSTHDGLTFSFASFCVTLYIIIMELVVLILSFASWSFNLYSVLLCNNVSVALVQKSPAAPVAAGPLPNQVEFHDQARTGGTTFRWPNSDPYMALQPKTSGPHDGRHVPCGRGKCSTAPAAATSQWPHRPVP